jgi:hypothetical protein
VNITIEQDVRLPVIQGFVFVDTNNNGVQESWERSLAGVDITIQGTDVSGAPVYHMVTTGPDGTYSFAESEIGVELVLGNYWLTENQPAFMLDGTDYVNGVATAFNDAIPITNAASVPGDCVFTELGLEPSYLSMHSYLTSTQEEGIFLAFDNLGNLLWTFVDAAYPATIHNESWADVTVQDASFSADGSELYVTVSGYGQITVPTFQNQGFAPWGQTADGRVVRLNGPLSDFV